MIRITQGDTYPTISIKVLENGLPVDLTGATAIFSIKHKITEHIYKENCTISGNVVSVKLTSSSTVEAGVYKGNVILTLNNEEFSIPNDSYIGVVIKDPTDEGGATPEYTPIYMLTATYDVDEDGIIDLSEKLNDGSTGKSYADIAAEIDADILTHKNNATAHHSNANDPTTNQKAALDAASSPSGTNKFITQSDVATYGDMFKSTYDTNNSGVVDSAEHVAWSGITSKPSVFTPDTHSHSTGQVTDLMEYIQDTIASTIVAGTQIQTSYDDTNGKLTISYVISEIDQDLIEDIVGGLIVAGTGITAVYNDLASPATLTISLDTHTHSISNITGLQTALDSKIGSSALTPYLNKTTETLDNITGGTTNVHFTSANKTKLAGISTGADVTPSDVFKINTNTLANITPTTDFPHFTKMLKDKLDGIEAQANKYTLPKATAGTADTGTLGGVKIGNRLTVDSNGLLSADVQPGNGDMLKSQYAQNITNNNLYMVDTAKRIYDEGSSVLKSYANIASEIDNDIATHAANPSAHGTPYTNAMAVTAVKADSVIADVITKKHEHLNGGSSNLSVLNGISNAGSGKIITDAERTKLNNLSSYTLPAATTDVLGGVKIASTSKIKINNQFIDLDAGVMLAANYDKDTFDSNYVVDTASALLNGGASKTYANILTDISNAIATHTAIASAHHSVYTDAMALAAAKADTSIADAITKKHEHVNGVSSNLSVLNGISNAGSGKIITDAERTKLEGLSNYTLPISSASQVGGVQIDTTKGLAITAQGLLSCTYGSGTGDMLASNYDKGTDNTTYSVDTADKLKNGTGVISYTQISAEIDSDITTHASNATVHHSNANDPNSNQKAALAGTNGTPGDTNRYVTGTDARLTDSRTPKTHTHVSSDITDLGDTFEPVITTKKTAFNCDFVVDGTTTTGYVVQGSDSRLTDSRAPTTHASTHTRSGGSDIIALDALGNPSDTTDLNASTTSHGLLPKLNNVATQYLSGTGQWTTPNEATLIETFSRWEEGDISTTTTFMPYLLTKAQTISSVRGFIQTLPSGSSIKIDIRKNIPTDTSASIFSTLGEIPVDLISKNGVYQFTCTGLNSAKTSCAIDDVLFIVITQVGSTTPGTGLFLKVTF